MKIKNFIKKLRIGLVITILFTSCHFNRQYINSEEDKNEAEKVLEKFYDNIMIQDFESTCPLFSKEFYKLTDKKL